MICLGLWTCLSTKENLQLGFEPWRSWELLQTDRQRIPDRRSEEFERALTNRLQKLRFVIFQSFSLDGRRVREVWHVQNGVTAVVMFNNYMQNGSQLSWCLIVICRMGRQLSSNRLLHRTVSLYSELWESCLLKKMSLPVLIIHVCLVECFTQTPSNIYWSYWEI